MSSWQVKFTSDGQEVSVDLVDTFGPLNEWRSHGTNALIPSDGEFTNQTNQVVPTMQPSWVLKDFDIDDVSVGGTGAGSMQDNDGTFPTGDFAWSVEKEI